MKATAPVTGLISSMVRVAAQRLIVTLERGGWVYACGNGGSGAMCDHLVAELVGRYRLERPAYRALSLVANTATLTAIANDYGWHEVFARQLRGVIRSSDTLITMSTSGLSANVIQAARIARGRGASVIAMVGPKNPPGSLARHADVVLDSPGLSTAAVQEHQLRLLHELCHLIEQGIDGQTSQDQPGAQGAGQEGAREGGQGVETEHREVDTAQGHADPPPGETEEHSAAR